MTVSNTVTSTTGAWDTTSNYTLVVTFDWQEATDIECWVQDRSTTPYTLTQLVKDTATYPTVNAAKFNFDTSTSTVIIGTDHRNDADKRIYARRSLPLTQPVDFVETSAFPAADHEEQMDKMAMILQDHDLDISKKIGMSNGTAFSGTPTFPEAVASSFVRWNSGATDLEAVTSANAGFTAADVANVPSGNLAATDVQTALDELQTDIDTRATSSALTSHTSNTSNPHSVAHSQLADKGTNDHSQIDSHIASTSNPHSVTASQVGNNSAQWNANKIKDVTVDDSAIADGKALVYDGASGDLQYKNSPVVFPTLGTARQVLAVNSGATDIEYTDNLAADDLQFDAALGAAPSYAEGLAYYDPDEKTLAVYNDVSGMKLLLGQQHVVKFVNKTGAQLDEGTVVYVNGAQGNRATVAKAKADLLTTAEPTIGIICHANVAINATGYAISRGLCHGLDTSGYSEGDTLYLSAATAGALTTTRPDDPNFVIRIGVVTKVHASDGHILVCVEKLNDYTRQKKFDGIEDKSKFSMSYDASTRVFTVTCASGAAIWVSGTRYTPTTESLAAHAGSTGKYYVYYDSSGVLTLSATVWDLSLGLAPVCMFYYLHNANPALAKAILLDERHPAQTGFPNQVHKYLHENFGTQLHSGGVISGYTLDNANSSYAISAAQLDDEDLETDMDAHTDGTALRVFYLEGTSGAPTWNWDSTDLYGVLGDGTDIYYNQLSGGNWLRTAITSNNRWVNYYPIALPLYGEATGAAFSLITDRWSVIMGQAVHTSLASAQAETPANLANVTGLSAELVLFARIIYKRVGAGGYYQNAYIDEDPTYYETNAASLSVSLAAAASVNKFEDDITWAGETTQDITVSATITDARNAIWQLTDAGNDYENILCSIKCPSASTVRITFDTAQTGTYRLIGLE